jgi:putative transcriptional regulator
MAKNSIDVRAIRRNLGLTQDQFSRRFQINIGTLREWEQGRCAPQGPSRVLLFVISQAPEIVEQAVKTMSAVAA